MSKYVYPAIFAAVFMKTKPENCFTQAPGLFEGSFLSIQLRRLNGSL